LTLFHYIIIFCEPAEADLEANYCTGELWWCNVWQAMSGKLCIYLC